MHIELTVCCHLRCDLTVAQQGLLGSLHRDRLAARLQVEERTEEGCYDAECVASWYAVALVFGIERGDDGDACDLFATPHQSVAADVARLLDNLLRVRYPHVRWQACMAPVLDAASCAESDPGRLRVVEHAIKS